MQVVYTPAHLGHDISVETYMGTPIPANEVAERAERIRKTLEAASGARRHAGRGSIATTAFPHDGHNLMRYRPEAVTAAILSVAGETGR